MCRIDLESCSLFKETRVKARKEHVCSCCGGTIRPGQTYVRHFSMFEDQITSEKQCLPCTNMVVEFTKVHGQHSNPSYMPELLRECIQYERDEGERETVKKWTSALRAMEKRQARRQAKQPAKEKD